MKMNKIHEAFNTDLPSHDYIKSNRYALKELAKKVAKKYDLTVHKLCLMIGQRKEYIEASCDKYSFNKKGDLTSCQISEIKSRIEHVDNFLNRHLERNPELAITVLFEKYITEHIYKKSKFDGSSIKELLKSGKYVAVPVEPTQAFKQNLASYLFDLWTGESGCDWDGFVNAQAIKPENIWSMVLEAARGGYGGNLNENC
ncbi:hypothetical protein [Acinetobacter modestus]|uniref:hypothetical protein n=1 Tax=Acinetobacter modestus TaxID=1776740 RepID=UPI00301665F0